MKMPAALATASPDRVPQWRPGHALTLLPCGDAGPFSPSPSSFSQDTRLPLVSPSMDSPVPALLPRPFVNTGEKRRMKEESAPPPCLSSSSTAPVAGVGGEERRKRFPILGPTRQETEMYFRTRRSIQRSATDTGIKAEVKRHLVTRSADRIILPDSTPTATPRLLPRPSSGTTSTTLTTTTTTVLHAVSNISLAAATPSTDATTTTTTTTVSTGRIVNISARRRSQTHFKDCEETGNSASTSHSLPSTLEPGTDHSAPSSHVPGPERLGGPQSAATSSPALERLENSPEQSNVTLPWPGFQHLHNSSSESSPHRVVLAGGRKKSESSPFSDFGHQSPRLARTRREQTPKTLQPSKHGFHLRSKSPTFKRLVAATEKLQDTVVGQNKNSGPRTERYSLNAARAASPGGIVLPAVAGVWDGEATEEGEGESDEDVTYLYPHPFLSSLPHTAYRSKLKSAAGTRGGHKVTRSTGTTMSTNPKDPEAKGTDHNLIHGLGAWEVDPLGMESGMDPMRVPVIGMTSDTHTELHLFLPRLADTVSEDGSAKLSPDRHCPRPAAETRTLNEASQRGKAAMPQIVPSQRAPQRSHTFSHQVAERSARPQERRFTSPVRVVRRDRTPNNRRRVLATPLVESYASYEPYLKGEHLKEKLEDLPTLISLDQE